MAKDAAWMPPEIADPLIELQTWVRWQWLLRGFGRVALMLSLGLAAAFVADYRWDLSASTRLATLIGMGSIASLAFLIWIVVPFFRRMSWNELAALADAAHPKWEGALTSSVELFDPAQAGSYQGSPVMRDLLLQQTRQRVDELDLEQVVSSRRAWQAVRLGLAGCFLLAIPVFAAPSTYRQLWQRLILPWGNWGTAGAWQIDVANGDRVVARGTDMELLAKAERSGQVEPPKSLTLEWRDSTGTTDRRTMPFDEGRKAFVTIVPHVMRDLEYRVVVEQQRSREYRVQVVEPPVITKVRLDIEPPAYCGWPAQALDGAIGTIRVFDQSRMKFTLEFNKPVDSGTIVWKPGTEPLQFTLGENRQSASVELLADAKFAGPFSLSLIDEHKLTNNDSVPRELLVIADEPPKLVVTGDHSIDVQPSDVVPIKAIASDDIGIGQLELHVEVANVPQPVRPADGVQGRQQTEHKFSLDLNALKLTQGDIVVYKVRLTDEQPAPGPHEVWSEPRVLRINRKAVPPGVNELAKNQEALRDELDHLRRDASDRATEIDELVKDLSQTRKDKDVPDLTRVDEVNQKLHELTERGEQLAKQLEKDPLFQELAEQVAKISDNELAQAEKELTEAREAKPGEVTRDLRQGQKELNEAAKKLAALDKPFQQLADLQKDLQELRRLARQADQLANRAEELAQKSEPANKPPTDKNEPLDPNAAAEQKANEVERQRLADQQKELANALNDLLKEQPELLAAARRDQLEQLAKLAQEARELAKQQTELAQAAKEKQVAAAEQNAELAQKQEDLQKRAEAATKKGLASDESKSVKPANNEPLKEATDALKQGNLAEAQKQQQQAANELDRLAAELAEAQKDAAESDKQQPTKQLEQLAQEQRQLAKEVAQALNEQRGEQQAGQKEANAAQPPVPNDQANAQQPEPQPVGDKPQAPANEPQPADAQQPDAPQSDAQQPNASEQQIAQQQRQQELNDAAGQLQQQLAEAQQRLSEQPLNLPQAADGAEQAKQRTEQSQQNMQAANKASEQGNSGQAAQASQEAANSLQQAAQAADAAAKKQRHPTSPIPRGVGQEVSEAVEQLRQAVDANQAATANASQPSDAGMSDEKGQPGQSPDGQPSEPGPSNVGEPNETPPGQSSRGQQLAQMAQRLRDAAQALSQAAQQTAPSLGHPTPAASQPGQPQPGQPANAPEGEPQLAQEGEGSDATGNLQPGSNGGTDDLPTQLKKSTGRNWGQLSSKLKTELTQAAKHQAHGDYSKLIKLYFQEIAKPQESAKPGAKP